MNLLAAMRYLVALDKHKHFGRAAQACHITQPALSNALRALEDEFGVAIIKRSRTYGGVTHEGEVVLETARRMLHEVELLTQELESTAESPRGALRLGAVPTAMPLLTVFAAMLWKLHPGLVPTMLALSSPDIEAQLEDLSLDLALGYTERLGAAGGRFRSWPQASERYYFLRRRADVPVKGGVAGGEVGKGSKTGNVAKAGAAAEGGAAGGEASNAVNTAETGTVGQTLRFGSPITWSEAANYPLCQLTPDMHNRAIIDAALASIGMSSAPAIETNSLLAVTLAVSVGDVCAILPGAMVAAVQERGELEALPLIEPDIRTPLGFIALVDERPSRAVQAALRLMAALEWAAALERHAGEGGI